MRKCLAVHVKKAVRGCHSSYQRAYIFDKILKKEEWKIFVKTIACSLVCNWIWQYVNVQAVSMPPQPTPLVHRWPRNREILAGRGGLDGRQEVRVTGGRLFSSSKTSRLWTQTWEWCAAEMSTPSPLSLRPLLFLSFLRRGGSSEGFVVVCVLSYSPPRGYRENRESVLSYTSPRGYRENHP